MQRLLQVFFTLVLSLSASLVHAETVKVNWPDLIPAEQREDTMALIKSTLNPFIHKDGVVAPQRVNDVLSTTVSELANLDVQITGYLVPLETSPDGIITLLLAPYAGACIHVPPPPPNQLIYIELKAGEVIPWEQYNQPIVISGELEIESIEGEMAMTGYSIKQANFSSY